MKKIDLVLDCADPERLAAFWAPALGYEKVVPVGRYVILARGGPGFPKLVLQQVPEPKVAKNRMHLDIIKPDIEAEAARLEELGARRVETRPRREQGVSWLVMADPERPPRAAQDPRARGAPRDPRPTAGRTHPPTPAARRTPGLDRARRPWS